MTYNEVRNGTKPWAGLPQVTDMPAGMQTTHNPRPRDEHFEEYDNPNRGTKPLAWLEGTVNDAKADIEASASFWFALTLVSAAVTTHLAVDAVKRGVALVNHLTGGRLR